MPGEQAVGQEDKGASWSLHSARVEEMVLAHRVAMGTPRWFGMMTFLVSGLHWPPWNFSTVLFPPFQEYWYQGEGAGSQNILVAGSVC